MGAVDGVKTSTDEVVDLPAMALVDNSVPSSSKADSESSDNELRLSSYLEKPVLNVRCNAFDSRIDLREACVVTRLELNTVVDCEAFRQELQTNLDETARDRNMLNRRAQWWIGVNSYASQLLHLIGKAERRWPQPLQVDDAVPHVPIR